MRFTYASHVKAFLEMHIKLQNTNKLQLQKASGVNRTTILEMMSPRRKCGPRIDMLMPVLKALNTSMAEFEAFIESREFNALIGKSA